MEATVQHTHNPLMSFGAVILGILFMASMQAIIGLPLLFIGLVMVFSKRKVWLCTECHGAVEKMDHAEKVAVD